MKKLMVLILLIQKQKDLLVKQQQIEQHVVNEINEMNKYIGDANDLTKKKRQQILDELNLELDDFTEYGKEDETDEDEDASMDDVDDFFENLDEELNSQKFAYMPCAAHNIQLVIKDGLKLSTEYEGIIEKISKNIVTKSKCCVEIAEELRALNIQLCKKNLTRWNSTLFMIRSVLKLTPSDFQTIKSQLPVKTVAQREVKKNFGISKK